MLRADLYSAPSRQLLRDAVDMKILEHDQTEWSSTGVEIEAGEEEEAHAADCLAT